MTARTILCCTCVAAALSGCGAASSPSRTLPHLASDGVEGLLWGLFWGEDTAYAAGYTDAGFRQVTVGMTRTQVHNLLGPPLQRWSFAPDIHGADNGERWSHSPGDDSYRIRVVRYRGNVVVRKQTEFYVD